VLCLQTQLCLHQDVSFQFQLWETPLEDEDYKAVNNFGFYPCQENIVLEYLEYLDPQGLVWIWHTLPPECMHVIAIAWYFIPWLDTSWWSIPSAQSYSKNKGITHVMQTEKGKGYDFLLLKFQRNPEQNREGLLGGILLLIMQQMMVMIMVMMVMMVMLLWLLLLAGG